MKLNNCNTLAEACQAVYPHELFKEPLAVFHKGALVPFESKFAIMRDDGLEIGCVGEGYTQVQPKTCFDYFEPLYATGILKLTNGYQLQGGKGLILEAQVKNKKSDSVVGDKVGMKIALHTKFDGTGSHGISLSSLILNCLNGAVGPGDSVGMSFRHTASITEKLKNADVTLQQFIDAQELNVKAFNQIAAHKMEYKAQVRYVYDVFGYDTTKPDENSPQLEKKCNRVIDLLESQPNYEMAPLIKGTAWQAYNAVTNYLTHESNKNEESRIQSNYFGPAHDLNQKAFLLAMPH